MHVRAMLPLLRMFERLCEIAHECNTRIALEWPAGCLYWKRRDVRALIQRFDLKIVKFHGCALNLRSIKKNKKGQLVMKPWKIATDCDEIIEKFSTKLCTRNHEHAHCRGTEAKGSEDYSYDYVSCLHDAFRKHVNKPGYD